MLDLLHYPDWSIEGRKWPHRAQSQFIDCGAYRWHVQRVGAGPVIVLLHGAGASSHSWGGVTDILQADYDVITLDLPGHGFTRRQKPAPASLGSYATAVGSLLDQMNVAPAAMVGHSAGAAIMMELALQAQDRRKNRDNNWSGAGPCRLISINGALAPFAGPAGFLFPAFARMIHINPAAPHIFAASARDRRRIARLIAQTGSTISEENLDHYHALLSCSGHVSGVLRMMANWDLTALARRLQTLENPTKLITGANDKAVPPADSEALTRIMPHADYIRLDGFGHLLHEEAPHVAAREIGGFIRAG